MSDDLNAGVYRGTDFELITPHERYDGRVDYQLGIITQVGEYKAGHYGPIVTSSESADKVPTEGPIAARFGEGGDKRVV